MSETERVQDGVTRREFLWRFAVGLGVVTGIAGKVAMTERQRYLDFEETHFFDETWKINFLKKNKYLDYDISSQLARRFDDVYKKTEPHLLPITDQAIHDWIDEAVPYFNFNGIFKDVYVPDTIQFKKLLDGTDHALLLGASNCYDRMSFNYRFANPESSWFDSPLFPAVVIHELDHIQQREGCGVGFAYTNTVEGHAQVATYEVLASLANNGNAIARTALLFMLRRETLRASYLYAVREGREEEFSKLIANVRSSDERAEFEQEQRFFAEKLLNMTAAYTTYSSGPLQSMIIDYFRDGIHHETRMANYNDHGLTQSYTFPAFALDDFFAFLKRT